jgi:hypothetical protein
MDDAALLDIGDTLLGEERWAEAIATYEEVKQRTKPNHDWAMPSILYCRYRSTGESQLLEELRYMANAGPDECGMASILTQMFGGYSFEDRRQRAEWLMKLVEPDFAPTHRPHTHEHDDE